MTVGRTVRALLATAAVLSMLGAGAHAAPATQTLAFARGDATVEGHRARVSVAFVVPPGGDAERAERAALAGAGAQRTQDHAEAAGAAAEAPVVLHWPQFFDADAANNVVPLLFNPAGEPTPGAANAAATAAATWSAAPRTTYRSALGGPTSVVAGVFDRKNVISWPERWPYPQTTLAVASAIYLPENGELLDVDIEFNRSAPWTLDGPDPEAFDLESVLLHEEGHVAGLDHSADPQAVMFPSSTRGQTRRALGTDDIRALSALYPVFPFAATGRDFATRRSFAGTVASFTDSSVRAASSYRATIDWGDGSPPVPGTLTPRASGGFDVSGLHTFTAPRSWPVTVTVERDGATVSATSRAIVSGEGATTCNGVVANAVVDGNVEVAPGESCHVVGARLGHDIAAASGARLELTGAIVANDVLIDGGKLVLNRNAAGGGSTVGNDVRARSAVSVLMVGATVGRDAEIVGATDGIGGSGVNVVCASTVARHLRIRSSTSGFVVGGHSSAIGDAYGCPAAGGNTVGRDLELTGNDGSRDGATSVAITDNEVRRDLICSGNVPPPSGEPASNRVAGAVSPECSALAVRIPDTFAPETTITHGPAGPTADTTPAFVFESDEPGTFECSLDQGVPHFSACAPGEGFGPLPDGIYTFRVRATDAAGNTDPSPALVSLLIDTAPPGTAISSGPTGTTSNATPEFTFASSESPSRFECRVDSGPFASCRSPHTTAPLASGAHTFEVRAVDAAGNIDLSAASRSFRVCTGVMSAVAVPLDRTVRPVSARLTDTVAVLSCGR